MKFSLVIPCYNEAKNLPLLIERCKGMTDTHNREVIFVDNGSTDNSPEILSKLPQETHGCRSIRVDVNQGYGYGILAGLRESTGDIIGWTHADMQTDPQDVLIGWNFYGKHNSNIIVKGLRHGRPMVDVAFTLGMSAFETLLLSKPLWDINAQPTIFPRSFFEAWQNPPHDFSLDLYAYYKALQVGLSVRRFPVRFGKRAYGVSHWNVNWAAKWKFICRTVKFSQQLKQRVKQ